MPIFTSCAAATRWSNGSRAHASAPARTLRGDDVRQIAQMGITPIPGDDKGSHKVAIWKVDRRDFDSCLMLSVAIYDKPMSIDLGLWNARGAAILPQVMS